MKKKAVLGALIGGLLSFASPAASAATVVVTYTGTVQSGTDGLGLFGSTGASLANASFVARYIFDTDVGRITGTSGDVAYGGYSFGGAASPLISATLKVHNVIQAVTGEALADLGYFNLSGGTYYESSAVSNPFIESHGGIISSSDVVFGNYLSSAISSIDSNVYEASLTGGMTSNGGAPYSGFFDFNSEGGTGLTSYGIFASGGTLQVSYFPTPEAAFKSLSIPAPEPTAWMMMILGFGFIGAMFRRKSRQLTRSAAA